MSLMATQLPPSINIAHLNNASYVSFNSPSLLFQRNYSVIDHQISRSGSSDIILQKENGEIIVIPYESAGSFSGGYMSSLVKTAALLPSELWNAMPTTLIGKGISYFSYVFQRANTALSFPGAEAATVNFQKFNNQNETQGPISQQSNDRIAVINQINQDLGTQSLKMEQLKIQINNYLSQASPESLRRHADTLLQLREKTGALVKEKENVTYNLQNFENLQKQTPVPWQDYNELKERALNSMEILKLYINQIEKLKTALSEEIR